MVRLPRQGGLPPAERAAGAVVEIACDESGFSGTNLLDPATPTITHASVDLRVDEAVTLLAGLRSSRCSPAEFKSGQFLRSPRAGEALGWFLTELRGRAHVHLVDKEYFLATRIVDLFLTEPTYAAGTRLSQGDRAAALTLYRAGRAAGDAWGSFLAAFADLVRFKHRPRPDRQAFDHFFAARDALADAVPAGDAAAGDAAAGDAAADDAAAGDAAAGDLLREVSPTTVWAVLVRMSEDDRSIPPPLEPLLPALAETVLFWSAGHRQILVIHDEQSALTAGRLRRLQQVLADGTGWSPMAGLVTVDSRDDPRVQVADLLAGLARRLAGTAADSPLRPFLSPTSLRAPS